MLQPSYKWRLHCYGAHTPNLLPFLVYNQNLHEMKSRSLVVSTGDPPGDSVSVPVDLLPMGVVFFPSLPFMGVVLSPSFVLGDMSGEGGTFLVSLSLFSPLLSLPLISSPSPSFSFYLLFFLLFFPISFSIFPFLSPFSSTLSDVQTLSFPFFFFSSFPSLFPFLFLS